MTAAVSLVTGWSLFLALVLAAGAVAGRWVVLPRMPEGPGPPRAWLEARAARFGRVAGLLLPPALGLVFLRQLQEFRDPFASLAEDVRVLLTGTPWGATWLWAVAGSVIAALGFLLAAGGRRAGWCLATVATLALGVFPAFTGHAGGVEDLRWLSLAADTLHVLGAGGWIGGLTLVLFLELRWRREATGQVPSLLPAVVPAFSPLAVVCVGILVTTGVFASWVHLPNASALWSTGYGRLLTLKVLLVAVVLALGALNWKRLTPRLTEPGGTDDMRRAASIELLVAHVVIVLTAILVRTSPLGH